MVCPPFGPVVDSFGSQCLGLGAPLIKLNTVCVAFPQQLPKERHLLQDLGLHVPCSPYLCIKGCGEGSSVLYLSLPVLPKQVAVLP